MRVVITGGPCSGKTTLISELVKRGYSCLCEVARDILLSNRDSDAEKIQRLIFEKQIEQEKGIKDRLTFLDRGLVDNYAYFLHINNIPDYVKSFDYRWRYDKVFFLERLPFENDELRIERNDKEAREIHEKIREAYFYFGYDVIEVPRMDVNRRADFILEHVQKQLKGGKENGKMLF